MIKTFEKILEDISDHAVQVTTMVEKLTKELDAMKSSQSEPSGAANPKRTGLSYLDVKNMLLMNYNCDLTNLMNLKCEGSSLRGKPSVVRLIENRTVIEKTRGLDQKLKYQIEKLVRAATFTPDSGATDPLGLRANLDNFEDEEEEGKEKTEANGVYKPPKLAAVRYDGDDTELEKKEKRSKIRARAVANASMIKDLDLDREEPEEIFETNMHRFKEDRRLTERTKYEEDNFTRLTLSKKEKARMKRVANSSSMGDVLTNFEDSKVLWQTEEDGVKRPKKTGKESVGGKKRKFQSKGAANKIKNKKKKRFA